MTLGRPCKLTLRELLLLLLLFINYYSFVDDITGNDFLTHVSGYQPFKLIKILNGKCQAHIKCITNVSWEKIL